MLRGRCPKRIFVLVGYWQRGSCPTGVIVLWGSCPQGSCPQGSCPQGSCPRGNCLWVSCPRTLTISHTCSHIFAPIWNIEEILSIFKSL